MDERDTGDGAMEVRVTTFTPAHSAQVATWRYEGPWAVYDPGEGDEITAAKGYHAIVARGTAQLVGYVCIGQEARVPGLAEDPAAADVGVGIDPALVGRGLGRSIVAPALSWVEEAVAQPALRAVVQAWNLRSLALCARLGFTRVGHHRVAQRGEEVDYVVLRRPVARAR